MNKTETEQEKPTLPLYPVPINNGIAIRDSKHHCVGKMRFNEWVEQDDHELTHHIASLIRSGEQQQSDLLALAKAITMNYSSYAAPHYFCRYCKNERHYKDEGVIQHEPDCPVLIAERVIEGAGE